MLWLGGWQTSSGSATREFGEALGVSSFRLLFTVPKPGTKAVEGNKEDLPANDANDAEEIESAALRFLIENSHGPRVGGLRFLMRVADRG